MSWVANSKEKWSRSDAAASGEFYQEKSNRLARQLIREKRERRKTVPKRDYLERAIWPNLPIHS